MKKLVFVSFAMSVLGGISESAHGMFNAQDETQNADNGKLLTHEKLPENEREEGHQSESYNYQIGDLRAQVSRLTALVETSLANEERKNKEKDQSEVYNYQIGDLKAQISRLTALAETSLADEERKSKEKDQSEVYNYQIGNLGAQISRLTTLVQDLNEKVMILSEEKESLIAGNVVKSRESTEQKEEAKSTSELEQQGLVQTKKSAGKQREESHREAVQEISDEKANASVVDINSVTASTAKDAIEEALTELLNVAGENATKARIQEFYGIVNPPRFEKGWKAVWSRSYEVEIVNSTVTFKNSSDARALPLGLSRIKNFLRDVQTQISDTRSCANFASSSRENSVSEIIQKPDVFAAVNVSTVTVATAKSAIEEMLTELLNVAGEEAVKKRRQEFYDMVKPRREKGWKVAWLGSSEMQIEGNRVKFIDGSNKSRAFKAGFSKIQSFLENVQKEIDKKTKS